MDARLLVPGLPSWPVLRAWLPQLCRRHRRASAAGDPALCQPCPALSAWSPLAGARLLLLPLGVPCSPGQHPPHGSWGGLRAGDSQGYWHSHAASGAIWGPGKGVRGVPKEMASGERKSSDQGSMGGCRVHLSGGGCHTVTSCAVAPQPVSLWWTSPPGPEWTALSLGPVTSPVHAALTPCAEGPGHAALPVLPPYSLPGPVGCGCGGSREPSLMVSFCRTS